VTALSWTRRVSAALRVRAPGVYRSLRRAYALVEYAGWRFAGQRDGDAYGESFWDLHADAGWDWAGFAACIQCYAKSHAVVDVGCGDAKVLAELLRVDATLRVQGYDGSPEARARAAQRGVLPIVALLLAHGAHINARDSKGWTPLDRSVKWNHTDVAKYLRQHGGQ